LVLRWAITALGEALCLAFGEALGFILGDAVGLALGEALGLTLGKALVPTLREVRARPDTVSIMYCAVVWILVGCKIDEIQRLGIPS
jgi:hypothetical protein